jgi:hypothetical protein
MNNGRSVSEVSLMIGKVLSPRQAPRAGLRENRKFCNQDRQEIRLPSAQRGNKLLELRENLAQFVTKLLRARTRRESCRPRGSRVTRPGRVIMHAWPSLVQLP